MYTGYGRIECYESGWLIIKVKEDIGKYYRQLVSFYSRPIKLSPPAHGCHITGIAGKYEQPKNWEVFWKYHLQQISFLYNSYILEDGTYYWMTVECPELEKIRVDIGLTPTIKWPWHLTIGNLK